MLVARHRGRTACSKQTRDKAHAVTDYPLKGVVKKVDLARGSVMIAHEAIPGFMAAMTMPFSTTDRDFLESLVLGDQVEALSASRRKAAS